MAYPCVIPSAGNAAFNTKVHETISYPTVKTRQPAYTYAYIYTCSLCAAVSLSTSARIRFSASSRPCVT
jgi:hypothetical protein